MGSDFLGRSLILFGVLTALLGVLVILIPRVPFLGRLPGDFSFHRDGFSFYLPLATSILASMLLTLVINLLLRFFGK